MNPIRKMTMVSTKLLPMEELRTSSEPKKKKHHFSKQLRMMMGPASSEVGKQSPKNKLRAVIRYVIQNVKWLNDVENLELSQDPRHNAKVLLRSQETFTLLEKYILVRPPAMRTEEETKAIWKKMTNFRSIKKFDLEKQLLIAASAGFGYYKRGRVLVRQGDSTAYGSRIYFVAKGEVELLRSQEDPYQPGTIVQTSMGKKATGDLFGEVALLYGTLRTCTAVSTTDVELVELKKRDFERILKGSLWSHWTEMKAALETYYYFNTWDEDLMKSCCAVSDLKTFEEREIIIDCYKPDDGESTHTYFILKGMCEIIGSLVLNKTWKKDGNGTFYNLHPNQELIEPTTSSCETIFLRLCTLSEGQVFSIGEFRVLRRIMASEKTRCLVVPTQFLLEADKFNLWERTKYYIDNIVPSIEAQFRWFLNSVKCERKKKKTLKGLKHSNWTAKRSDVPYSLRLKEVQRLEDIENLEPKVKRKFLQIEKIVQEMGKLHLPVERPTTENHTTKSRIQKT